MNRKSLKLSLKHFICLGLLSFLGASQDLKAQGDLLIYPKRIVFDGQKRLQELSLVNNGNDTARYEISVIQIRMKEDGSFENIVLPDEGQKFADKNFRFFPHSVTLAPKEVQTVKVQLIKSGDLTNGEYRSHLYFRSTANPKALEELKTKPDVTSLSIHITPIYGLSIPVLIRIGESNTEIGLSKINFGYEKDSLPVLKMNLDRSGNMSIYGDISVDYVSAEGKEARVALVKGVAVYAPNLSRRLKVLLDPKANVDYHKGSLHVLYTETSGKVEKVAQDQIFLR